MPSGLDDLAYAYGLGLIVGIFLVIVLVGIILGAVLLWWRCRYERGV